jgi:hypothetical protein
MSMTAATKRIQQVVEQTRRLSERTLVANESVESLEKYLGQRTLQGLRVATGSLGVLATHYGRKGIIRVIDGDTGGWEVIYKGIAYRLWSVKIQSRISAKVENPHLTSETACLHCHHWAIGNESAQAFTRDLLLRMARVPGMVKEAYWQQRIFEPFVLRLHQRLEPVRLPDDLERRSLGPYGAVLECWDSPQRLADAICGIADYHCRKMEGGGWGPEFIASPFDLIPCEILAIDAVRHKLGLVMPAVVHPLLQTPVAHLQGDPKTGVDAMLQLVERVYLDVFQTRQ